MVMLEIVAFACGICTRERLLRSNVSPEILIICMKKFSPKPIG